MKDDNFLHFHNIYLLVLDNFSFQNRQLLEAISNIYLKILYLFNERTNK